MCNPTLLSTYPSNRHYSRHHKKSLVAKYIGKDKEKGHWKQFWVFTRWTLYAAW